MSLVERVVLGTSTLVGAILLPQSVPRQAFMKALGSGDVMCFARDAG